VIRSVNGEDSRGNFLLSEVTVAVAPPGRAAEARPLRLKDATHSFASAKRSAALTIDGDLDTGWSVVGRVGEAHHAVYQFAEPLTRSTAARLPSRSSTATSTR